MSALEDLILHWKQIDPASPPFVHPADQAIVNSDMFVSDMLPYPYVGNLKQADIWVLMLNSNHNKADKKDEKKSLFANWLVANLRQSFDAIGYPFASLDPAFANTGTYKYYNARNGFGQLIAAYAAAAGLPLEVGRKVVASRVAIVQLFPYRSTSGVPKALRTDTVPSVARARAAVHEAIGTRLIVVPRCAPDWGLAYDQIVPGQLVTYRADQARGASLKPASAGGKCAGGDAIIQRMLTVPGFGPQ